MNYFTFEDWKVIEKEEERRGQQLGKSREKMTNVQAMIQLVTSSQKVQ